MCVGLKFNPKPMYPRTPAYAPVPPPARAVSQSLSVTVTRSHTTNINPCMPSLVCDLQELYRILIDDFLIQYCRRLRKKDFTTKAESVSKKRKGKRIYLNNLQTRDLMKRLYQYFECEVEVPRIRIGKRQTIETLISEEALLLAKFLRDERQTWVPRIASL